MSLEKTELSAENRIRLPSGKDAGLADVLAFCYGLSETDVQVLMDLMKGDAKGTEELESELKLSKASINRSLNKLLEMEFAMRIKESGNKAGRPRYLYKARDYKELKERIMSDIEGCGNAMEKLVEKSFLDKDLS
ncbi:transcriptional regulator [Sulfolobales archaeon HS-7]|nr:transcriptional regulator [Sulfolobales archaeon HS-7]